MWPSTRDRTVNYVTVARDRLSIKGLLASFLRPRHTAQFIRRPSVRADATHIHVMNSLTLMGLTRLARSVPERLASGCVIVSGEIAAPTLALLDYDGIEQLSKELRQTRWVRAIVLSTRSGGVDSLDREILAFGQRTSPIIVVVCRSLREASRVITATGRSSAVRIVLEGTEPLGALVGAFISEGAEGSHLSLVLRLIGTRWGEAANSILAIVLGSGFRTTAVHVLASRMSVSRSTLGRQLLADGARSP